MDIQKLAEDLAQARRDGVQAELPVFDAAIGEDAILDIQSRANAAFDGEVIGWKVGATNEPTQKAFGIIAPFYGPMPKSAIVPDGGVVEKTDIVAACEPEYAFRLARAWPEEGEAVTVETANDAVASVHIAIEIIGRRTDAESYQNGTGIALDFAGNAYFVLGDEVSDWREKDLANGAVESMIDGEVVQRGDGTPVMGDPINSLVWLGEKLAARGLHIEAGQVVSTGTCTPPVPAKAGTTYSARFATGGTVSVRFT